MPVSDLPQIITDWDTPRRADYAMFRDYYNGNHHLGFASDLFRKRYKWLLQQSRENLMPATVSAFTDLKRIDGWTNAEAFDDATELGLQRLAGMVHRAEFRDGDAFTITWPGPDGQPRAVLQRPDQMVPVVDDTNPDVLQSAARVWVDPNRFCRVNIYYPDRVERYVSRLPLMDAAGRVLRNVQPYEIAWRPFADDGGPEVIPHQFGAVPVCWWKRDADDPWSWGRSILTNAIPVQDELNYIIAVTNGAVEREARPIRYALVSSPDIVGAANGRVDFDPTREDVLTLTANAAGVFPGGNLDGLVQLQANAEQKIARTVGIPPYVFSQAPGEVPSGVSLRIVNERRTNTVTASNLDDTPVWRGQLALLNVEDCEPTWDSPMTLSEAEAVEIAAVEKNDLDLPAEVWLRTAGYDPDSTLGDGTVLKEAVQAAVRTTAQQISTTFLNGEDPANYGSTGA